MTTQQQQRSPQAVHLVVLQHGLWGSASNLTTVESLLIKHVAASASCNTSSPAGLGGLPATAEGHVGLPVRTLNSTVNEEKLTYDGIHTCGQRLVQLIRDMAESLLRKEGLQVTHLSFIGYSLGGLIARYSVGVLQHEGAFDGSDGFVPVNFVTIATPHLGAWRLLEQASWGYSLFNRLYHRMVPVIASMTGHQLMLKDVYAWDRPLLMLMSDPALPFYQGLERFKTLALLANTHHDRMVPYRTAAICRNDPYVGRHTIPVQGSKRYPSVVRATDTAEEAERQEVQGRWVLYTMLTLLPVLLPVLLVVLAKMSWEGRQHYAGILRKGAPHSWLLKALPANKSQNLAEPADIELGSESGSGDCSQLGVDAESVLLQPKADAQPGPATITASSTLEKQEWIIEHLNKLPWLKVDVDVRHGHAHAAIVLRNPKRFTATDHLEFLFSHMQW